MTLTSLLILCTLGQQDTTKITYQDGTVYKATLVVENIQVKTKYGILAIPVKDIRTIEVGFHLDSMTQAKVDSLINKMGDMKYANRIDAIEELIKMGSKAYPALLTATKHKDMEVKSKAQRALDRIKDNYPYNHKFKIDSNDRIETEGFMVIGEIVFDNIPATSEHFGQVKLNPRILSNMVFAKAKAFGKIELDANVYNMSRMIDRHDPTGDLWLDSGINLKFNESLAIQATGTIDLWPITPGQHTCGPNGHGTALPTKTAKHGALYGRVGEHGKEFLVGENFNGVASGDGKLYLTVGPTPWPGNQMQGKFWIKVNTN